MPRRPSSSTAKRSPLGPTWSRASRRRGSPSTWLARRVSSCFRTRAGSCAGSRSWSTSAIRAGAYSKAEIDAWLNTKGYDRFGLTGSIRDYYLKQSNGKVDYQNEVHGFYRAKKTKSYYQGGTAYERADELWAEVIAALDAEIDFSKFDNDQDGKTEAISLLYAGDEGTFGKGLWPHASASNEQHDGVRVTRYMMTAMDDQPTNYVFAHESGHMLFGWPDLYGVGDYSIMANRGANTNPVGIDDVLRADQGWIDVVDIESTTNARYQATPNGVVYRYLNPARPTEYFLWSNIQNTGEWQSLAGGGLLVWHFDKSISGNNPPQTLQLAVVQGGGTRQLSATQWPSPGSAKTDFFGKGVNAEFAATTKPASKWNNGSASGLRIYDIGASGPSIAFSVGVGPIPATGDGGSAGVGGAANAGSAGALSAGSGGVLGRGGAASAGSSGAAVAGSAGSGTVGAAGASGGSASAGGARARALLLARVSPEQPAQEARPAARLHRLPVRMVKRAARAPRRRHPAAAEPSLWGS